MAVAPCCEDGWPGYTGHTHAAVLLCCCAVTMAIELGGKTGIWKYKSARRYVDSTILEQSHLGPVVG